MDRTMQDEFKSCFDEWVDQQESDLEELLKVIPVSSNGQREDDTTTSSADHEQQQQQLRGLVSKGMQHFEEYSEKPRNLAKEYASTFFCPVWCSSFENSFLWMGWCTCLSAPSDLEARMDEITRGQGEGERGQQQRWSGGRLLVLSARQLNRINDLHLRTLREEERLGGKMATLQVN